MTQIDEDPQATRFEPQRTLRAQSYPPIQKENAEAQRRRGAEGVVGDFIARRGPGRRKTAGNRWVGTPRRKLAFVGRPDPAACAFQAQASPLLFLFLWMRGATSLPDGSENGRTDALRARRPVRNPTATDACIRSRGSSHRRPAITDRLLFCHQEAGPLLKLSVRLFVWAGGWAAFVSLCLRRCDVGAWVGSVFICVICGQERVGGRLCASATLRFLLWVPLCDLCGSVVFRVNEIALLWTFQALISYC